MYNYILGMVTDIEGTYVVVEAGGIGYQVYTPNPYSFDLNTTCKYIFISILEKMKIVYMVLSLKKKKKCF